MQQPATVWVFNGAGGQFPSAVFSSRETAEEWILSRGLTGVLTAYPVDIPVYDWAVMHGHFKPRRADQSTGLFIQRFSSAHQEHYHYDNSAPDPPGEDDEGLVDDA